MTTAIDYLRCENFLAGAVTDGLCHPQLGMRANPPHSRIYSTSAKFVNIPHLLLIGYGSCAASLWFVPFNFETEEANRTWHWLW